MPERRPVTATSTACEACTGAGKGGGPLNVTMKFAATINMIAANTKTNMRVDIFQGTILADLLRGNRQHVTFTANRLDQMLTAMLRQFPA